MPRPPAISANEKLELVLRVLSGELSLAQASRQAKVSQQSVANWRNKFIDGGREALEGVLSKTARRERELQAEIAELKTALGEAYIQLRVRRRAGEYRSIPFPNSRRSDGSPESASRSSATSSTSHDARIHGGRPSTRLRQSV
ncbi:helix-turn-helix domain-containing protein [Streptomyces sp. NPDC006700]|jgi:transposase|uniref:helix-turn-helix domain-containing protein n=1 Tax=Streptomyces sp. NPDC006700 TaxID=3154479 RepID=UPI00220C1EA3|nr:transposase [Streptomyces sp. RK44]